MNSKEGQNQSASFFKELGRFMKPYQLKYTLSVIISFLGVVSGMAVFVFVGQLISLIFKGNHRLENLLPAILLIVACKLLQVLLLNLSTWISHHAAYETLHDIRTALTQKMIKLPLGYFEKSGSGRLKTMIADRIEEIEVTLAHLLPEMTANLLIPLGMIIMMFFVDWRMSLCILGWIFVGLFVSCGMMIGYEEKYSAQIAAAKAMNQAVVEYTGGIEVIKAFNQGEKSYKKYEEAVKHHADYNVKWVKETQFFTSFSMAITPFSIFPTLILGLVFLSKGTIDAATLAFFMIMSLGFFEPIVKASSFFDKIAQMGTTAKEIREVLDYPELKRGEKEIACDNATVSFENIAFRYEQDGEEVLKDVSLTAPEGTMLALVGPSGSGKSTIAKLLAGYWDVTAGDIKIGGRSITEYPQEELNHLIAYVDQETFLFDMSIKENIRVGKPDATDEEVYQAAKDAGCDGFIKELPEGYETPAGSAGSKLSGGEKQRIAIARAILKNAPIMILDEATASTDPENEMAIQQALSKAAQNRTLIVVAHRLSTIVSAEQIAYIKDGSVLCVGTHEEMLKNCTDYAENWKIVKEGGALC